MEPVELLDGQVSRRRAQQDALGVPSQVLADDAVALTVAGQRPDGDVGEICPIMGSFLAIAASITAFAWLVTTASDT